MSVELRARADATPAPPSSLDLMRSAALGRAPEIESMPRADIHTAMPARDGARLETFVWLPRQIRRAPAILNRSPYEDRIVGWSRLRQLRYVDEGYALVYQMVRGAGASEGAFSFNAPHERSDGYDAVEWVAAQEWCDGAVGMEGASYLAMMQLAAASARPPHLRCIAPHVPCADFFREFPYFGGGFSRQHTLNWSNLISIKALSELSGGLVSAMPMLAKPEWLARMTSRPVIDAADGLLEGDRLAHFRDVLLHPTFDSWWQARHLSDADFAQLDLPMLLVSGVFDMNVGSMRVWRGAESFAPPRADRQMLIGPWDHGQVYTGSDVQYGPFQLSEEASADPYPIRLAFFDKHLKGKGPGPDLGGKAKIYITGANRYASFEAFPPASVSLERFFLASGGRANTARGDGCLRDEGPDEAQSVADEMISDPDLPFVAALTSAREQPLDLREHVLNADTLVYATRAFARPLTIMGEPEVVLHVSADTPDTDVGVRLAEMCSDGAVRMLARHFLRLRYREGWTKEVMLADSEPVRVSITLTLVAHEVAPGNRLALLIQPHMFPWVDPNPNTGEPIATAVTTRRAKIKIWHDRARPSGLFLPCIPSAERDGC